jgi:hypothetical protein
MINVTDVQGKSRRNGGGSLDYLTILMGSVLWSFTTMSRRRRLNLP